VFFLQTNGSGVLSFAGVSPSAGQIIQVVNATDSTGRSTTSGSYVTGSNTLSVTITPSSASNKIFVTASVGVQVTGTNNTANFTVYRNGSTNLGGGSNNGLIATYSDAGNTCEGIDISLLDSPSTTSATTYQVYMKTDTGGTIYVNAQGMKNSITAFEVKG
jgi:hypothetical protein